MLRNHIEIFQLIVNLTDAIFAFIAFWISFLIYKNVYSLSQTNLIDLYGITSVLIFLIWLMLSKTYRTPSRRLHSLIEEVKTILFINITGLLLTTFVIFVFNISNISRIIILMFGVISFLLILFGRLSTRKFLEFIRSKGKNKRFVLFIGNAKQADKLDNYFSENPQLGIKLIGYLNEEKGKSNVKYLGSYDFLEKIIHEKVIDCVFLGIYIGHLRFEEVFKKCETEGKEIKIIFSGLDDVTNFKKSVTNVFGVPMLTVHTVPNKIIDLNAKRLFDVIAATVGLVILSPLFIVVAILIKVEDSVGPVIFKQKRVGLNGRIFEIYKFRSMVANAETMKEKLKKQNEMSGPVFKIRADPRITRIGKSIRKTSIDELPQLFNVLKGDMSLVGPRPPLPNEVAQYENAYRRRLTVKSGITCIWQISGRNDISFEQWMDLDMQYIDNWSFWLDIKILLKTIPVVLFGKGAS